METFLTVLYVLVCVFLIAVVLLQAGRGGGMGAAFGGASQTVFGASGGANFLTRLTVTMAALFMLLSATLAYMSSSSEKSLDRAVDAAQAKEKAREAEKKPAASPSEQAAAGAQTAAPATTSEPIEVHAVGAEEVVGAEPAPALGTEGASGDVPGVKFVGADGKPLDIKLERVEGPELEALRKKAAGGETFGAMPAPAAPAPAPAPTPAE